MGSKWSMQHLASVVLLAAALSISTQAAAISYKTIVLTGDTAPGTDPGVLLSGFHSPFIDRVGQTGFGGSLTGTGVDFSNNEGIWSERDGALSLVAREGNAAPSTGQGVVFEFLSIFPVYNGVGQIAFRDSLSGTGVDLTNDSGIWSEGSGALSLVAREGDAAPGAGLGVLFSRLGSPTFNDAGQTAFRSDLTGTGVDSTNERGIWTEGGGVLGLVARTGEAAPGTGPGVVFSSFSFSQVLNGAGQTAFGGSLAGTGVGSSNDSGIWSEGSGTLGLVAREGDAAPGTGPGVLFNRLIDPVLNDAGQTAFRSRLTGTGVDFTNDAGIWSEGSGALGLVARTGEAAPGTSQGVTFGGFARHVLNGAGQMAFIGTLSGTGVDNTNNEGIWLEGGEALGLVARGGDAVPGAGPGVVFGGFEGSFPVLNGAGQTAFRGFLTGTGVGFANNLGIFATDLNGLLTSIARKGDLFDVNDDPLIDDMRTISSLELTTRSGGEDGRGTSFNDSGQLAFRLGFTDGTEGIFVAQVPIPEPGSLALLGLGGLLLLHHRRM